MIQQEEMAAWMQAPTYQKRGKIAGKNCIQAWTSLYMDGTVANFFLLIFPHEAGIWDPNYTPGVDFLDYDFL